MKRTLQTVILASCLMNVFAQGPAKPPAFEIVSIKPSAMTNGTHQDSSPGFIRAVATLKGLIRTAYGVTPDQIDGGPKWLDQDRFEIEGKADHPAQGPELRAMFETLLADRFKLEIHREQRFVSGYSLTIAKSGLRIPSVPKGPSQSTHGGDGYMVAENEQFSDFAVRLARIVGMPVVDETGNDGFYSYKLTWDPSSANRTPAASDAPSVTEASGASLFTALQEQLGLKLESRKVPLEVIVVDRAEKPQFN